MSGVGCIVLSCNSKPYQIRHSPSAQRVQHPTCPPRPLVQLPPVCPQQAQPCRRMPPLSPLKSSFVFRESRNKLLPRRMNCSQRRRSSWIAVSTRSHHGRNQMSLLVLLNIRKRTRSSLSQSNIDDEMRSSCQTHDLTSQGDWQYLCPYNQVVELSIP